MNERGEVFIAIRMVSGFVVHMSFQTRGRNFVPDFEGWSEPDKDGVQTRTAIDADIEFEVAKNERELYSKSGHVVLSWRRISEAEHQMFEKDRRYRNSLTDNAGKLEYDIVQARERHRLYLRRVRSEALIELDAQWMRATGQGRKADLDAIEAQRQKWRDAPADPRIAAAKTIEDLKVIEVE
jgi:hypothetical protein